MSINVSQFVHIYSSLLHLNQIDEIKGISHSKETAVAATWVVFKTKSTERRQKQLNKISQKCVYAIYVQWQFAGEINFDWLNEHLSGIVTPLSKGMSWQCNRHTLCVRMTGCFFLVSFCSTFLLWCVFFFLFSTFSLKCFSACDRRVERKKHTSARALTPTNKYQFKHDLLCF